MEYLSNILNKVKPKIHTLKSLLDLNYQNHCVIYIRQASGTRDSIKLSVYGWMNWWMDL